MLFLQFTQWNVSLGGMEFWLMFNLTLSGRFTHVAQSLFQVLDFLSKLDELVGKLSYANDPVKDRNPALKMRAKTLLKDFLKRCRFGQSLQICSSLRSY